MGSLAGIQVNVKKFDSINIIPFIDVMLVLLTIVLMTATFVVHGEIEVQLPESQSSKTMPKPSDKPINLYVTQEGNLHLDDTPITLDQLKEQLAAFDTTSKVMLRTDKDARFEDFVDVLAPLKEMGFQDVAIITKR